MSTSNVSCASISCGALTQINNLINVKQNLITSQSSVAGTELFVSQDVISKLVGINPITVYRENNIGLDWYNQVVVGFNESNLTTVTNFYNKTECNNLLDDNEPLLSTAGAKTINVGRGNVYFESNSSDNQDGAGLTLRSSSNPTTGAYFAVRASGGNSRLFIGQGMNSCGKNDLYVGFTGSAGEESDTTKYIHSITDTAVSLGTNTTINGDLIITGTFS